MSERVIGEARCPRGEHIIARAFADRIELRLAAPGRQGVTWKWETLAADAVAEFRDAAGYGFPVSCPCGVLLVVDLAALSRGAVCRVEPQGPGHTGVSFDRARNAVL